MEKDSALKDGPIQSQENGFVENEAELSFIFFFSIVEIVFFENRKMEAEMAEPLRLEIERLQRELDQVKSSIKVQ